ncbi:hypothetical protein NQ318_017825 [Aromia moschata]|uniref:Transmembrane protein 18 n=1 Tax=Aromia moschata TaxID=1265417 RepID=A0AAV8YGB2_9CUCU|nr:hypothetical protein NQ318_017825 [Aromia moschata]
MEIFKRYFFFVYCYLCTFRESINQMASTNWKIFSRQPYFDKNGLFISVVFSMPILMNCILMVGSWLYQSTQLMTNLKLAQLKEQLKKEKEIKEKTKPKQQ